MSKIPQKGPGGRDGEGDCFGRLFGELLPFVWWLFMNIAQNFKVLGWWKQFMMSQKLSPDLMELSFLKPKIGPSEKINYIKATHFRYKFAKIVNFIQFQEWYWRGQMSKHVYHDLF